MVKCIYSNKQQCEIDYPCRHAIPHVRNHFCGKLDKRCCVPSVQWGKVVPVVIEPRCEVVKDHSVDWMFEKI